MFNTKIGVLFFFLERKNRDSVFYFSMQIGIEFTITF
jgi:hypothetical protein